MDSVDERSFILLEPVCQNKIWGGRALEQYGYNLPDGPVGEAWAISAHPHGDCTVKDGVYQSMKLSELYASHPEIFGSSDSEEFPLLVKIIDAKDDLSIQVHPNNAYAAVHEDGALGKRECWYILDAEPGATIIVGQKAKDREEFARKVEEGLWNELLNEIPIKKGDFFQIDPGCVHAIKRGTMILETQQASDITYRVYDYDRRQDDGSLRELHLEKSLDVIDYEAKSPERPIHPILEPNTLENLVTTVDYTVEMVEVEGAFECKLDNPFTCVSVLEGRGFIQGREVARGDHGLILHEADRLVMSGSMVVILSHP